VTVKAFPIWVFVYGTLRKGHYNHKVMERAKGKYIGLGEISATMIDLGAYPAVCNIENTGDKVRGEIYEISSQDNLNHLDRLEGYPWMYSRDEVKVTIPDFPDNIKAWVYHMPNIMERHQEVITSGDWNAHKESANAKQG
jgi:gamma-glutamylaminecyclotransferase